MIMHERVLTKPGTQAVGSPESGGAVLFNVGGALVLILMIITVCAWVARRMGVARGLPKSNHILSIVASQSLGQRERIIVIDMNDKRVLLGVTSTQINCLATFDRQLDEANFSSTSIPGDFQSMLRRLSKRRKLGPIE